jgi:hypothetical protein
VCARVCLWQRRQRAGVHARANRHVGTAFLGSVPSQSSPPSRALIDPILFVIAIVVVPSAPENRAYWPHFSPDHSQQITYTRARRPRSRPDPFRRGRRTYTHPLHRPHFGVPSHRPRGFTIVVRKYTYFFVASSPCLSQPARTTIYIIILLLYIYYNLSYLYARYYETHSLQLPTTVSPSPSACALDRYCGATRACVKRFQFVFTVHAYNYRLVI